TRSDEDNTRVIEVPADALANGDPKFNVVMHPRDYVLVMPPATSARIIADAQESASSGSVLINQLQARIAQIKIDLIEARTKYGPNHAAVQSLQQQLDALNATLDAQNRQSRMAQPAQSMEYYIAGVPRSGVYSLPIDKQVTLKAAILAAGG